MRVKQVINETCCFPHSSEKEPGNGPGDGNRHNFVSIELHSGT